MDYFTLTRIKKEHAQYNVIFGERSNGKTTAVLEEIIKNFCESGYNKQGSIIRRWDEDFKGKQGATMYDGCIALNYIKKYTKGEYNSVKYQSLRWYLTKVDSFGKVEKILEVPFCYGFSINSQEHYKSTSYPNITTILFDEFISRSFYIVDEFVEFQNLLSTIIRLRTDVTIYMCGNTVNKYSPYFEEMGLTNIKKMKKGTIDVYTYGDSPLKVAVEYSDFPTKKKKSNIYFAFNNPKLQMIRSGEWEIDVYPHLPFKYIPKEVIFSFYIIWKDEKYKCEVINKMSEKNSLFCFIHKHTSEIKERNYPVFTDRVYPEINYNDNLLKPRNEVEKLCLSFFNDHKVFYQSNDIGESIRNYIMFCKKNSLISVN